VRRSHSGLLLVRLNQNSSILTQHKPEKVKKLKNSRNRTMAAVIALFLLIATAFSLVVLPTANAQIPPGMFWDLSTPPSANRLQLWYRYADKVPMYVYGVFTPNPVGIGQRVTVVMFNPLVPPNSDAGNDIRYEYTITVTKPDNTTEVLPSGGGTFISDPTGSTYAAYVPDQLGNYTFTIKFLELFYRWNATASMRDYYGVTFLEATSSYTVTVQQEHVFPTAVTNYPLPTEYWTRPIEGQNNAWGQVSSNWLNNAHDANYGSDNNRFQTEGIGPNSGHIVWTKVTEDGGVVGGDDYFSTPGEVFNAGHQYQTRFQTQIIMHGRLTYQEPIYFSGTGGDWVTVDLRTGEEIWRNHTMSASPSFGYYYDWDTMNDHGVITPGWIFSNNFGTAIHPRYGTSAAFNITNVPSGTEVIGPQGEILRYVMQNAGDAANPSWRLLQWNSSKVFTSQNTGRIDASLPSRYDWNVSIPWRNTMTQAPTIRAVIKDDIMLLSNGTLPTAGTSSLSLLNPLNATLFGVSLKEENRGSLIWMENYDFTFSDGTQKLYIRAGEGVFILQHMPMLTFEAYSMYNGTKLWESTPQSEYNPFGYYAWVSLMNVFASHIAYGRLYTTGYTGMVFCYDLYNGTLYWRQEALTGGEIFKYYTLFIGTICDGKIYVGTHEHSADTPLLKGARIRVFDAYTGKEIWSMLGWAHPGTMAIADGTLIYWNNYDHQVYAVAKGPSSTTVEAPMTAITAGNSVVIRGTVTDISAGTKQKEQAARFPNGVPAVSDASMGDWMEYVYMQKPRPANATGVEVTIDAIDPNNNFIHIGTATSDTSGSFSYAWKTPDVPGKYTVIATFAGTESYWPSYAENAMYVEEVPPATPPPPAAAPLPPFDLYILIATVVIVIAIAIVGILLFRKRP
jgi:hypothetical protein